MVLPFLLSTVLIEAVLPEPRGAQRARKPNRGHAVAHEVRGGGNPAGHPGARWRRAARAALRTPAPTHPLGRRARRTEWDRASRLGVWSSSNRGAGLGGDW